MRDAYSRREALQVLAAALGALPFRPGSPRRAPQPPNVLFIMTDDQRQDAMSAYGNPILRTPNMDRIAAGGVYVSARVWPTVDRLRGVPGVRTLRTVGGPLALRALLRRASPGSLEGVSVRRDLLTPAVAAAPPEPA